MEYDLCRRFRFWLYLPFDLFTVICTLFYNPSMNENIMRIKLKKGSSHTKGMSHNYKMLIIIIHKPYMTPYNPLFHF